VSAFSSYENVMFWSCNIHTLYLDACPV